jgi:hypothetical protein
MPSYSPDPKGLNMVRCDACNQDIAALGGAGPLPASGLTGQQVMQACPQVGAQVVRHEADCPAARPPVQAPPASAKPGPWRRFAREGRWSLPVLFIGLGILAFALIGGSDEDPGVLFHVLFGIGGGLSLIGLWWTAHALAQSGS